MTDADDRTVLVERQPPLVIIRINRPHARNAVDRCTADALARAFRDFERDQTLAVAILAGVGDHFCAGADLKATARWGPAACSYQNR